ncbi:major facilitator superfamily transporter [Colletotrichum abscissum]|uniref:major facilitator superfamily transporter n=1 Tax=Colletotrichum abscissum TaxID=1671311 RepID=UPI0027D717EC|nr:major facilitator superfamily transporter [Colletotrichum abscissum]KAK1487881.1 major facilitator superfamily transporter [Colletotrichum abscissum]
MVYTIISFANLTGPPLAGLLIKAGEGRYIYTFIFRGLCLALGTSFLVASRITKGG